MPVAMTIGEAATAAGVSPKMIRHYEQIGLVPAAGRTDAGYRQYGEREVSILRFIRQARRLGFSIEQIAELLGLWSDRGRASREVKALAQAHLDALEERMREMAQMQQALRGLVDACHGDDDPHCAILDGLAVASPQAPQPGEVGGRTRKRADGRQGAAPAPSAHGAPVADLMAWTHHLHRAGPGG